MITLRADISEELTQRGESFADVVCYSGPDIDEPRERDSNPWFMLWTKQRVYFPRMMIGTCDYFDGVDSVPRDPTLSALNDQRQI